MWVHLFESKIGQYDERTWAAFFGVSVAVVALIWDRVPHQVIGDTICLLWALHFLKCYWTSGTAHHIWGISERTYTDTVWCVLFCLHSNLHFIDINDRFHHPHTGNVYLVVDSKLCSIQMARGTDWERQKIWYDGFHRRHGIKYEIAVHVASGEIHWVSGGVFGSTADINLIRASGLLNLLLPGECMYADRGYIGELARLLCPYKGPHVRLSLQQLYWNYYLAEKRVIVENALGRIARFSSVSHCWRHSLTLHPVMFNVCAQIAALDIRLHPLRCDAPENPLIRALDPDTYDAEESY